MDYGLGAIWPRTLAKWGQDVPLSNTGPSRRPGGDSSPRHLSKGPFRCITKAWGSDNRRTQIDSCADLTVRPSTTGTAEVSTSLLTGPSPAFCCNADHHRFLTTKSLQWFDARTWLSTSRGPP